MIRFGLLLNSFLLCAMLLPGAQAAEAHGKAADSGARSAILSSESIYPIEDRPTPQCHASTIVQTREGGLVAAWFGGVAESHPQVGIWLSRRAGGHWSKPVRIAGGLQPGGTSLPCWNPVLFQPAVGPLILFFKVGADPRHWWGEMMTSADGGRTWRDRHKLPVGALGPIKNKPVQLPGGAILCPSSIENDGWGVHFELTRDLGKTWEKIGPLAGADKIPAIQPSILFYPNRRMQILCRTRDLGLLTQSWSADEGRTWSPLTLTSLPCPNSGIDAVTLRDSRQLLVYNPSTSRRTPLAVAISRDGKGWKNVLTLEDAPGEYSYPAVSQTADGKVHITYTWRRRTIRHVVVDPGAL